MQAIPEPEYQATVSPMLLALLRSGIAPDEAFVVHGRPGAQTHRADLEDGVHTQEASFTEEARVRAPRFDRVVLRRDGARPLVLSAAVLWSEETKVPVPPNDTHVVTRTSLYVTEQSEIAAQLCMASDEEALGRPVFLAAMLSDEADFARLKARGQPELCFAAVGALSLSGHQPSMLANAE